jgi:hypothetical protein
MPNYKTSKNVHLGKDFGKSVDYAGAKTLAIYIYIYIYIYIEDGPSGRAV